MSDTSNNYKNSDSLTMWVRYMLYAKIVVAIISIGSNFLENQLLSDYQNGVYTSQNKAIANWRQALFFLDSEANDQRQLLVAIIYSLVFVVSYFLILRWIHRANHNARQLGAKEMKFTPGWSIGYYFIPILRLWKPYQAMKEIWKASHNPSGWPMEKVSPILHVWWFLWLATNLLSYMTFRMIGAESIHELMNLNIIIQISDALTIPLALLTLPIVNSIYQAQSVAYESANKSLR